MIPNYEVTQNLLRDEWRALARGRRLSDRKPVLLRSMCRAGDGELLGRELALLRGLAVEGIPRPLEMAPVDGRSWLVTEDAGGSPLHELLAAGPLGMDAFFPFALRLVDLLVELHRREIVLRNLSPHGLLFDSASGALWLTDLCLGVRSSGEAPGALPRSLPANRLAYISPEQTGRMNRAIDYRTDFYSLGAILYEALTGSPPFQSRDPLELIHWHIARTPTPPAERAPGLPAPLSEIVMKLLSKMAEDRYQSALGLRADLEAGHREWLDRGRISAFPLGERDVSDRFMIPQRLYGREREVENLLAAFVETCDGRTSMMLVEGYSGIGKTSLIRELYKPIVERKGYFISGKFDQVARGVPFGALIQAFRGLVRQLLTESEARLALWRERLQEALDGQGGVLAEVIPEIELIVGPAPPLLAVGPAEALNRFQLVFQNFVGALARPEHPLVVFLDDLQWADAATLNLLGPLLASPGIRSLFLMGACRDNEVDDAHPLTRALLAAEASGAALRRLRLGALELPDLTRFIADALRCEVPAAAPLADLVWKKTGGNPFFVIQFLRMLRQDGLLSFDYERGNWTYRIGEIASAKITDNVIDLMTTKIQRMPAKTQRALTLASCIGSAFDHRTLGIISEQAPEDAVADLREALEEGLILPAARPFAGDEGADESLLSGEQYSFLHDRVQQAAYALIPEEDRQLVHLAVGRLLRERADGSAADQGLFDVVRHLNLGSGRMTDEIERLELARLNLSAGRKARSSTAYAAALDFFDAGLRLLREAHWEEEYDLAFALHFEAAESRRLCARFEEAEQEYARLLSRARTRLDQARVHNQRIIQCENQSRYADALAGARDCLSLFDVSFPDSVAAQEAALEAEIEKIQSLLAGRPIAALLDLPVMTDPEVRMVMSILVTLWSSAYISGEQALTRFVSALLVRLSLLHGNSEESAYGYATHAITVGPVRQDYESAYEFGELALRVNERFDDTRLRAKICQQFQAHVALWRRPLQTCLTYAREASRSGFASGDFTYGIYGAFTETWAAIVITQDLAQYVREYTPNLGLFRKLRVAGVGDGQKIMLNWARALMGETRAPLSLSDDEFDEAAYVERYRGNPFYTMFYSAAKLHTSYLLGEHQAALDAARLTGGIVEALAGTIWTVIYDFWGGLAYAANFPAAPAEEREALLKEMNRARRALEALAENCPENFRCQALLLAAEIERATGRERAAAEFYERALRYADETRAVQYQALASELYGRFRLESGQEMIATLLLGQARDRYAQWGAAAKVEELERRHAGLLSRLRALSLADSPAPEEGASEAHGAGALDLFSVMKASHAIAGEIEMERLLAKLMRIILENAGAERGYLLLEHDGELFIHAEGSLDGAEVTLHDALPLDENVNLPRSVINYVRRTSESVVLPEAAQDERYGGDPYIQRFRPRSVMCVRVLNQGRPVGVLYLENNLAGGAFTQDRILICQLLASQAAISLANARLYHETRSAESTLRSIMQGTASETGDDFFASLARHLSAAIPVKIAFVTECANPERTRARTLAFWDGKGLVEDFEYDVHQTTCEKVYEGETCFYGRELQKLFPEETALVELNGQSYIGIPIRDSSGSLIGHLAVIDDRPMDRPKGMEILQIFAARAGAELERMKAEAELRRALAEIERLKNQFQADAVYLQEEIRREHNFDEVVGSSPALLDVLGQVERIAPTDATVLILGETGTGKELIARALHERSPRKNRPLVKVNCGAITAGLVESELFGHVKGAFTGAIEKRIGRFELADGGTLFLDEVGELPLETQVKLLRVLQEGEFEPVGSSRTIQVDVRIIAATNRNLEEEIRAGRFRADLFYRLNVLPLRNPPLRERLADIPQLATFFLTRSARRFGRKIDGIAPATLDLMKNYSWPGNIRELQNLIERAVVLSAGPILTIDPVLLSMTAPASPQVAESPRTEERPAAPSASLDDLQRQHILRVLSQTHWVIEGDNGAAKLLNLHPNTLRSRMKKMGIQRPRG